MAIQESVLRAYDVVLAGDTMSIVIRKEFDFGSLHQDWAHHIIVQHPGPYRQVSVDMSHVGLVSSTFFAGLMQLHFHYTANGSEPVLLVKPDARVLRNLKVMRMDTLVTVDPR